MRKIGKTKDEQLKERVRKILKKRVVKLGGEFELPPKTAVGYNRRKLIKSASFTEPKVPFFLTVGMGEENKKLALYKQTFKEDEFE